MFFSFIIIDLQIDCIFLWYSSAGYIVNTYLRACKCISHIPTGRERLPDWGFYTKYSICITSKLFQCPNWDILLGIAILYAAWKVSVFAVFLVYIFLYSDWIRRDTSHFSVFSPNAGKYGPEKLRNGDVLPSSTCYS